jgi:hypothetical protein
MTSAINAIYFARSSKLSVPTNANLKFFAPLHAAASFEISIASRPTVLKFNAISNAAR